MNDEQLLKDNRYLVGEVDRLKDALCSAEEELAEAKRQYRDCEDLLAAKADALRVRDSQLDESRGLARQAHDQVLAERAKASKLSDELEAAKKAAEAESSPAPPPGDDYLTRCPKCGCTTCRIDGRWFECVDCHHEWRPKYPIVPPSPPGAHVGYSDPASCPACGHRPSVRFADGGRRCLVCGDAWHEWRPEYSPAPPPGDDDTADYPA